MDTRLDRLVTLYLVSPFVRLTQGTEPSVPILMYHSISDEDESEVHPYYRTRTSATTFASHMEYLKENGYHTCSLTQALRQLQQRSRAHPKLAVITFDDGYRDFYQQAFPLLDRHGFSATVFLPTAYVGDDAVSFKGRDCLTWAEVRELSRLGILFGSHTVTHPQLYELSSPKIREEVVISRETIEQKLGCAVDSFAYPYAFPETDDQFKTILRDTLRSAGYQTGVCTTVGLANFGSDPLFMPRLPINSCDDDSLYEAKLNGGYDWVAKSQYLVKLGKQWLNLPRPRSVSRQEL
jgi:peptidoglycan/xylan/chitin deacetylase (PgdA/CDA1 family)